MNTADYRGIIGSVLTQPALFISISGAHLYGFPSPDSDVDLRGCHVLPVNDFMRLEAPGLTVNQMWILDGVAFDLVSHDLVKYVTLLLRQNGPPDAVRISFSTSSLRPFCRHWKIALCSLSTGKISP